MKMNLVAGLERQCDNAFAHVLDSLSIDADRYQNTEKQNRVIPPLNIQALVSLVMEETCNEQAEEDDEEDNDDDDEEDEDYQIAVSLWRIDDFNRFFDEYRAALNDLKRIDQVTAKNQYTRDYETLLNSKTQSRIIDLESREYKVLLLDF